jgi:hypothetical protein
LSTYLLVVEAQAAAVMLVAAVLEGSYPDLPQVQLVLL